ncbi:hypothetical protein IWQ61_009638 [Dispira simplex]|nr:hypothetical protein IWQ61_009638 [Dispira simplex]
MRFFVLPLFKDQWAFHCQTSTPPTGRVARWVDYASRKWEGLAEAPLKSWKNRLYQTGMRLMDRIDHHEWFLKSVPTHVTPTKAPVYHPKVLPTSQVHQRLVRLVAEKRPYHKRYFALSCLWLPLTATFTLVPIVPNIPFFYNLFRVYSHYRAYRGAEHLGQLLAEERLQFDSPLPSPLESRETLFRDTHDQPLPVTAIRSMCHELDLPLLEINLLRAHGQTAGPSPSSKKSD